MCVNVKASVNEPCVCWFSIFFQYEIKSEANSVRECCHSTKKATRSMISKEKHCKLTSVYRTVG